MKTEMVPDALNMAQRTRGVNKLVGLITHSDAGSQFTSMSYTERLEEFGAAPSIGTIADSYDNALAESINNLYKTECIYHPEKPRWNNVDEVELATLNWVHWFNHERLHSYNNYLPPTEAEENYYAQQQPDPTPVGNQ